MKKLKKLRMSPTLGALSVTLFLGSEVGVIFYFISQIAVGSTLEPVVYGGAALATLWLCSVIFWRAYKPELKLYARERRKKRHGHTVAV